MSAPEKPRAGLATRLALAILTTVLTLVGLEGAFRLLGWDFAARESAFQAVPPFYRQPTLPEGEAYFRRPGPEEWTGRVLQTGLAIAGAADRAYEDEAPITVRYDREGFRNPEGLADWQIAVVGDSFTELGFLPEEALFTTVLGERLGVKVKNLGVSYTGPRTALHNLTAHGKAASTTNALLVFYEGNDLDDLFEEERRLFRARTFGIHESREVRGEPQRSFLVALFSVLGRLGEGGGAAPRRYANARWLSGGEERPITILETPLGREALTPAQQALLTAALGDFAREATRLGLTPAVAFMPAKHRVFAGQLAYEPGQEERITAWLPNDLPALVRESAEGAGARFIDLTPPLRAASERGVITYNLVWDTHLTAEGSRLVGEALAEALRPPR